MRIFSGYFFNNFCVLYFIFILISFRIRLCFHSPFVPLTYYDLPNIKFWVQIFIFFEKIVGIKWVGSLKEDASEDNTEDIDDKDIDKESKETSQASENSEEADTKKGKYKDTFPLK